MPGSTAASRAYRAMSCTFPGRDEEHRRPCVHPGRVPGALRHDDEAATLEKVDRNVSVLETENEGDLSAEQANDFVAVGMHFPNRPVVIEGMTRDQVFTVKFAELPIAQPVPESLVYRKRLDCCIAAKT